MPSATKFGKREHPAKAWILKSLQSIRCQIGWFDFFVGLAAVVMLTFTMVGWRYQPLPEQKEGLIAAQDIRSPQEFAFEDVAATAEKKQVVAATVPALYELDLNLIVDIEAGISRGFQDARKILERDRTPARGEMAPALTADVIAELEKAAGKTFPANLLPVLLRQRFSPALEGQILRVLDTVLRGGIVRDRAEFIKNQRIGITLPDGSIAPGRTLADAFMTRDLPAALEYLRQFQFEFSSIPAADRPILLRFLESLLVPTLSYNEKETLARRQAAAAQVPPVMVHIQKGQTIIRGGEEITRRALAQWEALRNLQKPRNQLEQSLGFCFFICTFVYALWRYLVLHQERHRQIRNHALLILMVIFLDLAAMRLLTALAEILSERLSIEAFRDPVNIFYSIPFAFGAVLITLLVDSNLGILTSLIMAALSGLFYGDINICAFALVGSLAGLYSLREYKDRAALLKSGLTIGVANVFCIIGIDLLRPLPIMTAPTVAQASFGLMGGIFTAAITSVLLPILELLFKITTDIRLLELSNLNAPILRRLSVEAPGTYHHSLMVGTLGEAAAEALAANPLLARVGAYYHDLGKMLKPEYFVENQLFGINKHETLSPSMSCLIISSHVKDGLELAKEIGLPERIRGMIPQHHGTRIMTYFFQKAKDALDTKNQDLVEADFRYPGPKPQSKEAAIIMMADSVEAASRTLSNPSGAQIQGMIDRLVDAIVADDQLDECDITMREIRLVKESFFKVLMGLFHRRIDYPGYDFKGFNKEPDKIPVQGLSSKQAKAV